MVRGILCLRPVSNGMDKYEIEIKTLIGDYQKADLLRAKLFESYPNLSLVEKSQQLNHYFIGSDEVVRNLGNDNKIISYIPGDLHQSLINILQNGKKFSVRTRQTGDSLTNKVIFVIKASIDDTTSSNGISRSEFESVVNLSIDELDQLLINAGLIYQAKWSREREEYSLGDDNGNVHVCLDKNAGYGYLAEFEKVITDKDQSEKTAQELRELMDKFGLKELPQDRLERMFAYYNNNWADYYGTDKIFNIT
jgi:adenylate cyclase class IV